MVASKIFDGYRVYLRKNNCNPTFSKVLVYSTWLVAVIFV